MTTILDRIHLHLPLAKSHNANCLMLGALEVNAYRESFRLIYQIELPPDVLNGGGQVYRGFRLIPVAMPSFFGIASLHHEDINENIKHQIS